MYIQNCCSFFKANFEANLDYTSAKYGKFTVLSVIDIRIQKFPTIIGYIFYSIIVKNNNIN